MKRRIFLPFFLLTLCSQLNAQWFVHKASSATSGIVQQYPVDLKYNTATNLYSSLHQSGSAMNVVNYNGTTGAIINALEL
jgi:hypothetical protein